MRVIPVYLFAIYGERHVVLHVVYNGSSGLEENDEIEQTSKKRVTIFISIFWR